MQPTAVVAAEAVLDKQEVTLLVLMVLMVEIIIASTAAVAFTFLQPMARMEQPLVVQEVRVELMVEEAVVAVIKAVVEIAEQVEQVVLLVQVAVVGLPTPGVVKGVVVVMVLLAVYTFFLPFLLMQVCLVDKAEVEEEEQVKLL
jgi:hypothetical protein|tara:strand:- start:134 stop:565 length:432 start_codon:yes stop_codon:yes gene_type:complete